MKVLAGAVALSALVWATGCARQDDGRDAQIASPAPTSSASATPSAAPRFPVTVSHDHGETTLAETPQRIVALDAEEDTLAAVGLTPLTFTPVSADGTPGPWVGPSLDLTHTQALDLDGGIDLDQIRSLNPDLILRTRALGGSRAEYAELAAIAPTVWFGYGEPWQVVSRAIGRAVGLGPEVDAAVASAEDLVARAGADRPGLTGRSFAVAYVFDRAAFDRAALDRAAFDRAGSSTEGLTLLDRADPAAVLLRALGLEPAPDLDADLLLLAYANDDLAESSTDTAAFRRLRAVKAGTYARLDAATFAQLRNPTLLSVPWSLGQLAPSLDRLASIE